MLFASERGQGRAAFFAARRSKPLTLRSGEYAGEWLCAQQFRAHNHDDKAVIPPSQVGQVYERKVGQFPRASRAKVIDQLARDLRAEFPDMRGFSRTNLLYMRAFASAWPEEAIVHQLGGQIPWRHNCVIIDQVKDLSLIHI